MTPRPSEVPYRPAKQVFDRAVATILLVLGFLYFFFGYLFYFMGVLKRSPF